MVFDNYQLRSISLEDIDDYFLFIENNRPRIAIYFPKTNDETKDLLSTEKHIQDRIILAEKREFLTYVIYDSTAKLIIGAIFLMRIDWTIPKGELGFFLDARYEKKGIMSKSLSLFCEMCFKDLGFNRIFMRIAEANLSSRHVAEKNNFLFEGLIKNDFKTGNGELIDLMYFAKTKLK
jgi:RimJ/RimL family protein N-acetyltransferase